MSRKQCVFKCDQFGLHAEGLEMEPTPHILNVLSSQDSATSSHDNRIRGTVITRRRMAIDARGLITPYLIKTLLIYYDLCYTSHKRKMYPYECTSTATMLSRRHLGSDALRISNVSCEYRYYKNCFSKLSRGEKRGQLWTEEGLKAAMNAVERGQLSRRAAACRHNIQQRILRDHLKTGTIVKLL
ncbi:unnamed protein product [Parnassius apollo]|uniref:(apollo) hypothetical protein n=1 Tax=Parnassius apollo TaxID=110799 RepID=A0A8S3W1W5_PARAO|nr:unnamed protein product [Parnassius apollo]